MWSSERLENLAGMKLYSILPVLLLFLVFVDLLLHLRLVDDHVDSVHNATATCCGAVLERVGEVFVQHGDVVNEVIGFCLDC